MYFFDLWYNRRSPCVRFYHLSCAFHIGVAGFGEYLFSTVDITTTAAVEVAGFAVSNLTAAFDLADNHNLSVVDVADAAPIAQNASGHWQRSRLPLSLVELVKQEVSSFGVSNILLLLP